MAEKFGEQVKIYYTNNKQTTSVTGIDASSYILFNGGSNHIYTHGKDFAADPSHTHKFLELSDVKDTFSKPADTTNTWVPVDVNGKIYHREIPAAYNQDPSTLSVNSANTANIANTANSLSATCAANDYIGIKGGGSNNNGYLEIYTGDDGNEPIYLKQYSYDSSVAIHSATLLDSNGNTSFPGTISSNGHTVLTNRIDPIISVACTSSGILTFTSNNNNKYEFNFNHTHDLSQLTGKIKVECLPDAALKDTTYSYSVTQSATNNNANPYLTLTPSNSGTVSNIQLVGGSKVTITRDSASKIIISSSWRPLGTGSNDAAAGNHTHDSLVVDYADSTSFNAPYHDFQVLYAGGGNGIEGRPADVDAFGLLRFRVATGWSGQILFADGGDLYIRSAVDNAFNKSLPWKRIIDSENIKSQSVNYANSAGDSDTVDGLHADNFVKALGTSNDNINSDWGQSFKTFDPIPSGTPPEQNSNISLLSIGDNFNRRKQLAFMHSNDNIYYRRHVDGGFTSWRRIAFVDSNVASATNADIIKYLGNHNETASGNTDNAANAGMLKSSGLFLTGTYLDNATPTNYGNIINVAGLGGSQLLLGWSDTNSITDKVYYRSHRDNGGGWGEWKQLAYTTDLTWENISGRPSSLPANGGNSDTVDGLHADNFVKALGTSNDNINSDWGQSFKTFDPIPSGTPPEQNSNISLLSIGDNFNRRKQLAFMYSNDNIYYRRHVDGSFTSWRRIAFVDSNVASATKLQTQRTIWGRSFDGTSNISGNMTEVGDIIMSASETHIGASGSYSDPWSDLTVNFKFGGTLCATKLYAQDAQIKNQLQAQNGKFFTDDNGAYWTSDIRKKHDFSDITKDIVDKFFEKNYFKHFKWNDTNHDSWGVAAQEFEEWAPEAINTNEDGFKSANYDVAEAKAIAAMTYKIKEQQSVISELKEKLEKLENTLNKLI